MKHTTQVLQAMGPEKAEIKKAHTKAGGILILIGIMLTVMAFVLAVRVVDGGNEITWLLALVLGTPLACGIAVIIIGAIVASGEVVKAAVKDVVGLFTGAVKSVRKNGGSGT